MAICAWRQSVCRCFWIPEKHSPSREKCTWVLGKYWTNCCARTIYIRAIGVSHTACKDEFRQNLWSHSWSVFLFLYEGKLGFRCKIYPNTFIYLTYIYTRDRSITHSWQRWVFDKIFDLTAGVYFDFHNIYSTFYFFKRRNHRGILILFLQLTSFFFIIKIKFSC